MMKRTIKDPVGASSITVAAARAAARVVYRDRRTGKLIVGERAMSVRSNQNKIAGTKKAPAVSAKAE